MQQGGNQMDISELVLGPPIGCATDTPVTEVARLMVDEGVGSLAVMDGTHLLGIVTDRDIVVACCDGDVSDLEASDIMTPEPDTIDSTTDLESATDWLNATGYRHLPVTEDGRLIGIISIKDLLWAATGR
jgi:CBS domain-containing protein